MTAAKKVSKKKLTEPMDEMEADSLGNAVQTENQVLSTNSKSEVAGLAEKIQKIADHLVFLEKKLDNLLEQSKSQGTAPRPSFGGDRPSYQGNRPGGFQGNRDGGFRGNAGGGYRGNREGGGFRGNSGSGGGGYQKFGNKPYFNKGGSSYGGGNQGGGYRPGGPSRDRGHDNRPSFNKGGAQGEPGNA